MNRLTSPVYGNYVSVSDGVRSDEGRVGSWSLSVTCMKSHIHTHPLTDMHYSHQFLIPATRLCSYGSRLNHVFVLSFGETAQYSQG